MLWGIPQTPLSEVRQAQALPRLCGYARESMEMLRVHHARSCSHCKAHGMDNLYVVDASFFPSSGAVNPALTVMANALRVGHHILERLA